MKTLITNYTFSAASKQVIFLDEVLINLAQILLIVNVTDGIILYNFADPNCIGTVSGNILTLNYNTTSMSNTDELLIYYDVPENDPLTEKTFEMFKRLVKLVESNAVVDSAGRQKVIIDGTSVVSGTVTVTNTAGLGVAIASGPVNVPSATAPATGAVSWLPVWIGPVDQRWQIIDAARLTYVQGIRSHLTFS